MKNRTPNFGNTWRRFSRLRGPVHIWRDPDYKWWATNRHVYSEKAEASEPAAMLAVLEKVEKERR